MEWKGKNGTRRRKKKDISVVLDGDLIFMKRIHENLAYIENIEGKRGFGSHSLSLLWKIGSVNNKNRMQEIAKYKLTKHKRKKKQVGSKNVRH